MRRRAIIASALLILAGASWHPARAATEIAFGITSQTAFSLAHYVATDKKLYEAENLKVDTFVTGAAVQILQQLAGGSLNLAQAATDQALRAILRGAPIRIVAGAASNAWVFRRQVDAIEPGASVPGQRLGRESFQRLCS